MTRILHGTNNQDFTQTNHGHLTDIEQNQDLRKKIHKHDYSQNRRLELYEMQNFRHGK
jgi:hypothetical protein